MNKFVLLKIEFVVSFLSCIEFCGIFSFIISSFYILIYIIYIIDNKKVLIIIKRYSKNNSIYIFHTSFLLGNIVHVMNSCRSNFFSCKKLLKQVIYCSLPPNSTSLHIAVKTFPHKIKPLL